MRLTFAADKPGARGAHPLVTHKRGRLMDGPTLVGEAGDHRAHDLGIFHPVLAPLKIAGSVRAGFRRPRATRWLALFGVLVLSTIALGVSHSTGVWFGVGFWSALWTHLLFGFVSTETGTCRLPRPSVVDTDASLLGTGAIVAARQLRSDSIAVRALDLAGADRGNGFARIGSFDPSAMSSVAWVDEPPDLDPAQWSLEVGGIPRTYRSCRSDQPARRNPGLHRWLEKRPGLGCGAPRPGRTGGRGEEHTVTSATGYSRLFSNSAAAGVYLATGYNQQPLHRRHMTGPDSGRRSQSAGPVVGEVGDQHRTHRQAVMGSAAFSSDLTATQGSNDRAEAPTTSWCLRRRSDRGQAF